MTEREQARYRASHGEEPKLEKNVWRANPEVCTKFVRLLDDLRHGRGRSGAARRRLA